jgi:segregation and condensation protein A
VRDLAGRSALRQPVEIELFEGPLDLLTTLVLREEIELLELPLADLVDCALPVDDRDRWSAAVTAELTLLLAALGELKARRMLGEEGEEEPREDAEEVAARLAARLVAYAPYQRAAEWLAQQGDAEAGHHYRRVPLPYLTPGPIGKVDDLTTSLEALLAARQTPSLTHMTARQVRIEDVLGDMRTLLGERRRLSFDEQVAGAGRIEVAVTLLAALELSRLGEVKLHQTEPFADITIEAR